MPRKERKAFIRQLKAKRKPNFEVGTQCKLLWEKIRRFESILYFIVLKID